MNKEEEIFHKILQKVGYQKREELEKKINQLIAEDPRLTRLGALYLISEDLGIFEQRGSVEYTVPIAKLVGGLSDVNVLCRVIGKRGPFKTDKTEYAYLRLGDNTGVVSAVVWSDALRRMAEINIAVGDTVFIKEAYTREGVNGKTEVHLSKNAVIKKVENSDIKPLDAFFKEELPLDKNEVEVDVKARIIGLSDEFSVHYQDQKIPLREAMLMIGNRLVTMTAWRDQVEIFKNASVGQTALIAAAKYLDTKLVISSKTCVWFLDDKNSETRPQLEISVYDELDSTSEDYTHIAACLNYIIFVKHRDIQSGKSYIVKGYDLIYKNKRWVLIPYDLIEEKEKSTGKDIQLTYSLKDLSEDLSYICVEGQIKSKTPLAARQQKNGEELEILNFWLTDGERNIYCRAFGKNAAIINNISDNCLIRLKWIRVRKTKFGNIELIIDDVSKVEPIKES